MIAAIHYDVFGKTDKGDLISGQVVINSQSSVADGMLHYSVVTCNFVSNGITCGSAPGTQAGSLNIPIGRSPDTIVCGNGIWYLGQWVTDTGITFTRVDGTDATLLAECSHLPPLIKLCCANAEINSKGPFIPYDTLVLHWNPLQFHLSTGRLAASPLVRK